MKNKQNDILTKKKQDKKVMTGFSIVTGIISVVFSVIGSVMAVSQNEYAGGVLGLFAVFLVFCIMGIVFVFVIKHEIKYIEHPELKKLKKPVPEKSTKYISAEELEESNRLYDKEMKRLDAEIDAGLEEIYRWESDNSDDNKRITGINLQKDYEAFCLAQKKGGLTATEFTELCNAMLFYLGMGNRSKATDEQHLVYTIGVKSFAVKCIYSNKALDKRTVDAFMVDPVIGYKKGTGIVYYIITNAALSDNAYDLAEKNKISVIDKTSFNLILNIAVGNYNKAVAAEKAQKAKNDEIIIPDVENPLLHDDEDTDENDYRTNPYMDVLEEDDGLSMEEIDFFESDIYDDK